VLFETRSLWFFQVSVSSADLAPGNYTLTAELSCLRVDATATDAGALPLRRRTKPSWSFDQQEDWKKTYVPSPFASSLPQVPHASATLRKTFTLTLAVRSDPASIHREAETLAARIAPHTLLFPPVLPLPNIDPSLLPPGATIVRTPYRMQFKEQIAATRADIKSLFSLKQPHCTSSAAAPGNNYRGSGWRDASARIG
jgi:hypothetical protein